MKSIRDIGWEEKFSRIPAALGLAILLLAGIQPIQAQPANDAFANRIALTGTNVIVSNSLAGASCEADEPVLADISSGQTAWWTWTAPANGIVTLSAASTNFSPLLAVYTGNELTNLSLLASNSYVSCYPSCGCHWKVYPQITFHVTQGQAYQIAVDAAVDTSATYGFVWKPYTTPWGSVAYFADFELIWSTNVPLGASFQMAVELTPAPSNDDFAQPIVLRGSNTHIHTSNAGATKEAGEPDHQANPGGSSIWFSYTAPASGRVTLATNAPPLYAPPVTGTGDLGLGIIEIYNPLPISPLCGGESPQTPLPTFYPIIAAYTGSSVDALTSAGTLALSLEAYSNAVCFDATKGTTYHIAFDGNQGTTGDITLYLSLTKPASNDSFERRIRLRTIYAIATGYNAGATHQVGEPAAGTNSQGKTVWWTWTAPVSGPTTIDLSGSDYSFPITVFTGNTLKTLVQVTNDVGGADFEAVAGQTYQIAVSDAAGLTGTIQLSLKAPIVELSLKQQRRLAFGTTLLDYNSQPGEQVLFQSLVGNDWKNVRTVRARSSTVSFLVGKALADVGSSCRAIIVDR